MAEEKITTCQICERFIKANNDAGVIAHHGYQRPYKQGWQTGSCYGARRKPYEEAKDALEEAIPKLKEFIAQVKERMEDFVKNPPETITRRNPWGGQTQELKRPEKFDPTAERSFSYNSYESEYYSQKSELARTIKYSEMDLTRLEKRLAAWKPHK